MDIFEQASEAETRDRALAIEYNRRPIKSLLPVGRCYSCDRGVSAGRLFCDKECAEDWELEQAAKRRRGEA